MLAHKQPMNLPTTIVMDFRLLSKRILDLPSDVDSPWVAFNSVSINRLSRDLSLSGKRTRMEWETMSTPDLVDLSNQLARALGGHLREKTLTFLIFDWQMKILIWNQNFLISAVIAMSQDIGKDIFINVSDVQASLAFQPTHPMSP